AVGELPRPAPPGRPGSELSCCWESVGATAGAHNIRKRIACSSESGRRYFRLPGSEEGPALLCHWHHRTNCSLPRHWSGNTRNPHRDKRLCPWVLLYLLGKSLRHFPRQHFGSQL